MSDDRPLSADRVPTLTEVVELALPTVDEAAEARAVGSEPPSEEPSQGESDVQVEVAHDAAVDASAQTIDAVVASAAEPDVSAGAVEAVTSTVASPAPADSAAGPATDTPAAAARMPETPAEAAAQAQPDGPPGQAVPPPIDVDALVGQLLSELTPRIDMLLESRLREALAPALARAADGLIRDTRVGLAAAMRDLAREAVDRALQRRDER